MYKSLNASFIHYKNGSGEQSELEVPSVVSEIKTVTEEVSSFSDESLKQAPNEPNSSNKLDLGLKQWTLKHKRDSLRL